jgi:hypothetical protein
MKTLLALLIAMLGFGATLAWAAQPLPVPAAAAASQAASAPRAAQRSAATPASRAPAVPDFDARLLRGPAVLCACARSSPRA